jgi:histidine triad (HIT) family protein
MRGKYLLRLLFRLAHSRWAGGLIRVGISHMAFAIPIKRLRETATLLAFNHPSPGYPVHVLIIPKREYRSLLDLDPADTAFQRDLFETVRSLVIELCLEKTGYRLIANGGAYQDIPILHFHLIAE